MTKLAGYNFNYYINFYFLWASFIDIGYCPRHNARYTLGKALRQFRSFYLFENAVAKDEISWKATTDAGIRAISVESKKAGSIFRLLVLSDQSSATNTRCIFPQNLKPEINMLISCMVEISDRKIVICIFLTNINFFQTNSTLLFAEHMMGSCKANIVLLTVGEILWCDHSNETFLALLSKLVRICRILMLATFGSFKKD